MRSNSTRDQLQKELEECRYSFETVYNTIDTAIFMIRVENESRFIFEGLNPAHERLTGLRSDFVKGKTAHEFVPEDIANQVERNYMNCVLAGKTIEYEESIPFDGKMTDWITKLIPIKDAEGKVIRIIGASTYITPLRQAIQQAKEDRDFVFQLINTLSTPIFYTDCNLNIVGYNHSFYKLFADETNAAVIGRNVFDLIDSNNLEKVKEQLALHKNNHSDSFIVEADMLVPSRGIMPMAMQCAPYEKEGHQCAGIVVVLIDISEKELRLRELSELAIKDALSGLYNRRGFNEFAHRDWADALRNCNSVSILMIDIDHFKIFNDTYGHPAGDEVLIKVAQVINSSARRPHDIAARYGGEEFILFLGNTKASGALTVAQRIQEAVKNLEIPNRNSPVLPIVTVSIGVASIEELNWRCADEPYELEVLIKKADQLLYKAKEAGRNRIMCDIQP